MREAIGNSFVMGMVAFIVGVIMLFFVGSISYSKAYRVKNKIINMIEENDGWTNDLGDKDNPNGIPAYLNDVGYQVRTGKETNECKCNGADDSNRGCEEVKSLAEGTHDYCVLQYGSNDSDSGIYYKVVTFMKFEFPVIGTSIEFPVQGETKTFGFFNSKK